MTRDREQPCYVTGPVRFRNGNATEVDELSKHCHIAARGSEVLIQVEIPHGRSWRMVDVALSAQTILDIADAIRCCPNHINEDPRTGARGAQFPIRWVGHAMWHLQNPEQVRPCLDSHDIIDVGERDALPAGDVIDADSTGE